MIILSIIISIILDGCVISEPETTASQVRCTSSERQLWKNNMEFTENLQKCSSKAMGAPIPISACLVNIYPSLSTDCGICLGDGSQCAAINCLIPCMTNQGSLACRQCFIKHCNEKLLACTGAISQNDLPPAPLDVETGSTTHAPIRTRKPRYL